VKNEKKYHVKTLRSHNNWFAFIFGFTHSDDLFSSYSDDPFPSYSLFTCYNRRGDDIYSWPFRAKIRNSNGCHAAIGVAARPAAIGKIAKPRESILERFVYDSPVSH
jgi:hypothetical protein